MSNVLDGLGNICSTRSDKLDVELVLKNTNYSRAGAHVPKQKTSGIGHSDSCGQHRRIHSCLVCA